MGGAEEEKRIAALEKEIAKRNRWIDQRDRRIDRLEQEIERLRRENDKLQQATKRQAAPFSRGEPKRNPRQRGRTATKRYGRRAYRRPRTDGLLQLCTSLQQQRWVQSMKRVLKRSIRISQRRDAAEIGPHGLMVAIGKAVADVDRLLKNMSRGEEVQRFARYLRRERSALFTFLHYDAVPATNFLAEQALRPAVVNRKISAGNTTPRDAKAQATLMNVLHSARKRSVDTISLVVRFAESPLGTAIT